MYAADTVALRIARDMQRSFTGKSLADFNRATAQTKVESIMLQLLREKWTAPSDDAPLGFKLPVSITIAGPAMLVGVEVRLATVNYFTQVTAFVGQVSQSG
jgi:hypothetical protein